MTGFIICLLALSHLCIGYLWRITMLRTSNGLKTGLTCAVTFMALWPLIGAAELTEWVKERMA